MAVQVDFIKSIPYFSGLGQAELDSILEVYLREESRERGDTPV